MKRLISLAVAVMLITLLGVCRSRAYDEYNLTDLAACSSVKSDSNGKGGFVCAFSGNIVFSARLVPDFSAYNFFCRRSDKKCVTERKLHLCTCF